MTNLPSDCCGRESRFLVRLPPTMASILRVCCHPGGGVSTSSKPSDLEFLQSTSVRYKGKDWRLDTTCRRVHPRYENFDGTYVMVKPQICELCHVNEEAGHTPRKASVMDNHGLKIG